MPFWKKSDDPWDQKPKRQKPVVRELDTPVETTGEFEESKKRTWNPGDYLDGLIEKHRTAAREEDAKKLLPPEKCPWCGKDMEQGFIITGRDVVKWYPGVYRTAWISRDPTGSIRIDTDGEFQPYKITWYCKDCKKMVIDTTSCENYKSYTGPFTEPEETKEQEESGEE